MKYSSPRYIYPPRPSNAIPNSDLVMYDDETFVAQIKMNGSNCVLFTNGVKVIAMNRHNGVLSNFKIESEEILSLYKGDGAWMVLNGEYLNKNKNDETGKSFNHKFIIFDILVYNGDYLIGKSLEYRIHLLDSLYGNKECEKEYLHGVSENVFRVKSYIRNFNDIFNKYTPIDVVEGLVLKRINSKLQISGSEKNNEGWQLKSRKSTKNYKF